MPYNDFRHVFVNTIVAEKTAALLKLKKTIFQGTNQIHSGEHEVLPGYAKTFAIAVVLYCDGPVGICNLCPAFFW